MVPLSKLKGSEVVLEQVEAMDLNNTEAEFVIGEYLSIFFAFVEMENLLTRGKRPFVFLRLVISSESESSTSKSSARGEGTWRRSCSHGHLLLNLIVGRKALYSHPSSIPISKTEFSPQTANSTCNTLVFSVSKLHIPAPTKTESCIPREISDLKDVDDDE
ncbi:hypothetical protein Nepgr_001117 [Nepenthes gracilis]|uniref:Uncharacterized protein n=1 Tax=Nepenthes gracilis TaxID=150966 RepID=A0AAD3P4M3_NEPGR|nr:hypothetical protein Nepgr_001117 [Nepenthes gracilis]